MPFKGKKIEDKVFFTLKYFYKFLGLGILKTSKKERNMKENLLVFK